MYAFVGIIMLIGIVKKNAIMMIDFALEAQRRENIAPADAIFRGVHDALPPDHDDHHGRVDGHACRSRWPWGPAAKRGGRSDSPSSAAWSSRSC